MNETAWVCLIVALFNAFTAGACLVTASVTDHFGRNFALFGLNVGFCVWNVATMVTVAL